MEPKYGFTAEQREDWQRRGLIYRGGFFAAASFVLVLFFALIGLLTTIAVGVVWGLVRRLRAR